MSASSTRQRSVDLPIDPDGAYAFLTDFDFLPEWYPGISNISGAPEDPSTGTRFVEHRRLAPGVSIPIQLTVTRAEPGRRFDVIAQQRGVGSIEGHYRLRELPSGGTRVSVSHEVHAIAPMRLAARVVLARGDMQQLDAMPEGLERWRGER